MYYQFPYSCPFFGSNFNHINAIAQIPNILLQVLDSGHLTDAKGRVVNFKNTVIILTSNIGAQFIDKMEEIGFSSDKSKKAEYEDIKEKVLRALKDNFRPEFLNRLDDVIIFDILSEKAVAKIVDIQLEIVRKRLAEKEIKLIIGKEAISYLAREGYNPQYGARPLKRLIQDKILTPVASLMISRGVSARGTINVGLKWKEFTFEVKGKNNLTRQKTATLSLTK